MKIVVIGGTGLIGTKLVGLLRERGHEAVAASPRTGVDALTGQGLARALQGASVVVDVSNSPSFEEKAVLQFFDTSTRNLLAAEAAAGVKHHVALSVVGTRQLEESGYFRAKIAQEKLIESGPIPYSIVQATQFFEFVNSIVAMSAVGNEVHVAPVLFQPVASEDVASEVCRVALAAPLNGTLELAGPEQFRLDELVSKVLRAQHDSRTVVSDRRARYAGALLADGTLVPAGAHPRLGVRRFDDFLRSAT
jgi:uncharacterized protein YbjT (DUF2867 family)